MGLVSQESSVKLFCLVDFNRMNAVFNCVTHNYALALGCKKLKYSMDSFYIITIDYWNGIGLWVGIKIFDVCRPCHRFHPGKGGQRLYTGLVLFCNCNLCNITHLLRLSVALYTQRERRKFEMYMLQTFIETL